MLQLGGAGTAAVKFLLAGAAEATLLSPMPGELFFARHLAEAYGVADRLRLVVAVAEELPFADATFDVIFSGSVHHMTTSLAFPGCARVLRPGCRFAATSRGVPPVAVGTRLFGSVRRETCSVAPHQCKSEPLFDAFEAAHVVAPRHLRRYPMIALGKFGVIPSRRVLGAIERFDDKIASSLRLRIFGSSVAALASRPGPDRRARPMHAPALARRRARFLCDPGDAHPVHGGARNEVAA